MLTPEEIASRQFLVSLRGYDRDEVTAFLREVAAQHARVLDDLRVLERELEQSRRELEAAPAPGASSTAVEASAPAAQTALSPREAFAALGEETTRILVAAEESAQAIREKAEERARTDLENARNEARDEVEGARRTASKIVADAERRRNAIAEDIRTLESTRDAFVQGLRAAMKGVHGAVRGMQTASGTTQLAAGDDEDPEPGPAGVQHAAVAAPAPYDRPGEPGPLVDRRSGSEPAATAAPAPDAADRDGSGVLHDVLAEDDDDREAGDIDPDEAQAQVADEAGSFEEATVSAVAATSATLGEDVAGVADELAPEPEP
ncbi:MAG: DivIVA domain-containing protein, partial [Actinobacteria bacterium]|nr:DivIVA domain-containing protein [Actinomycetota bacterium]